MEIDNKEFLLFLKCAQEHNLRYLCIGGYAVNYYGFHRFTEDMDIWIAPTNENKISFLNSLKCMGYPDDEIRRISDEDFTTYFMCTLGTRPYVIDILTVVPKNLDFNKAETTAEIHQLENGLLLKMVSYNFLKNIKLLSRREKDLWDIARLDELIHLNKNSKK